MNSCTPLAALAVLAMVACSEGPDSSDVARGETFLGQTGARFPLVKPLLGEARRLEEHGTRFRFRAASEGPNISGAWRPSGRHRLSAEFPAHAGGATRISNGPVTLEIRAFGARGAQGVLAEGRRAVLYRGAYADSDSFFVAGGDRVEEFILLASERAPRRFEYQLEVVKGVGRVRQLEGVVEVRCLVGADGRVGKVKLVRKAGHGLDEAALTAVKRMRCKPGRAGKRKVAVPITYTVTFVLDDW